MNKEVIYYPREEVLAATKKFDTPFFLYKENRIRENCRNFAGAFQQYFPTFVPLFAVKANANPEVLKIIIDEGYEFDASSETEVWLGKKLKTAGMFTGNYNPPEELKYAKDNGFLLNLDDISMLESFKKIGVPKFLSFRINLITEDGDIAGNVLSGPEAKYGVPSERAAEAYAQAKKLGVKKFGIHMMLGSRVPVENQNYFANIVEKLFEVIVAVKKKTGIEIEVLNIGGGFGVPYRPEENSLNMDKIAKSVRKVFDEQCKKYKLKEPVLMAEPGRWIVADAGWLVTKVNVIKNSYKKFVGVDASTNDMPRTAFYTDTYHHVSVVNGTKKLEKVSVVGRICENNDQFARDRMLPVMKIGDVVVIHNCGGHAFVMGHNYNGRLRHAEYLLEENGKIRQIRRAETFKDLYATCEI